MKMEFEWIGRTVSCFSSPFTMKSYRLNLLRFWRWYCNHDCPDLSVQAINDFKLDMLKEGRNENTVNNMLSSIRKMIAVNMSMSDPLMANSIFNFVKRLRLRHRVKRHKLFSQDDLNLLMDSDALNSDKGLRDAAIIALLFGAGLRRNELCYLKTSHYNHDEGLIYVVRGKGLKDRVVPLPNWAFIRVEAYAFVRAYYHKRGKIAEDCDFFFLNMTGKTYRRINYQSIYDIVSARFQVAGLSSYPHEGRANYITTLLQKGVDPLIVAQLVGHSHVQTTLGYDRRGLADMQKAVKVLDMEGL